MVQQFSLIFLILLVTTRRAQSLRELTQSPKQVYLFKWFIYLNHKAQPSFLLQVVFKHLSPVKRAFVQQFLVYFPVYTSVADPVHLDFSLLCRSGSGSYLIKSSKARLFYRMCAQHRLSRTINAVTVVVNPRLAANFERKQRIFQSEKKGQVSFFSSSISFNNFLLFLGQLLT